MNSLRKMNKTQERLQKEQRALEDEFLAHQEAVEKERRKQNEKSLKFIGRLRRLRLQQDLLKKRAVELLKKGLELDQLEERKKMEEERRQVEVKQAQLASEIDAIAEASTSFDWNAVRLDLSGGPLSPATLAALETVGQDSAGGTSQPGPSHSSGG
ncbi:hypothetical protein DL764_009602 [Monosporascus ibericus]|uniref:Uncharacterized protein n=1 Tax=Monosporascus ibericus TaxID=155417 RepID=A0A4V1X8X8_9PEZI|nr:hypothetical protein DL764_009602 [Monosporascus ibericus]